MKQFEFTIPGPPKGKARPRVVNNHAYTPEATVQYERLVRACWEKAAGDWMAEKDQPVALYVSAYYPVPESHTKKQKERELRNYVLPTKKPDIDNIVKIIMDGLNGVAYHDDKQVVEVTIRKRFDSEPRVEVTLKEVAP